MSPPVFRFAPSPNGYLHLGHAFSALVNFEMARAAGGRFLLRIEDIDAARCRPDYEQAIYEDLAWLGIAWEEPVWRQSAHFDDDRAALARLDELGLLYPSFESRGEISRLVAEREAHAPWPRDPDGAPLYPGDARALLPAERRRRMETGEPYALRLDMPAAIARTGPLTWRESGPASETGTVAARPQMWGDVVLARKETPTSYHLAVVIDDASPGRDRCRARAGSVLVDRRAPAAAGVARPAGAQLSPSPPDSGRRRTEALEIDPRHRLAGAARRRCDPGRYPPDGRAGMSAVAGGLAPWQSP